MKEFSKRVQDAAEMFLKRRGYEILDANWECPDGGGTELHRTALRAGLRCRPSGQDRNDELLHDPVGSRPSLLVQHQVFSRHDQ